MTPLRLVIADNESIIRMDLREMLEDAGHEIVGEATDGKRAVELTKKYKPDLVLMDIKMPEMDGITAAGKISEEGIAPVLLLTAFSQQDIVEKAKGSGVLGYLVKPVREENLFPAMEIALSRWQEMKELEGKLDKARDSLELRKTLDRAKGILMDAYSISEGEAYRRIQRYSMMKRMTIKDVAEAVVRSGVKKK
ncbi:MAG: response regulator [Schwartzia succinivorans]|jgi:response regulator NasT|uniref:ANTAR domain-containing response regulator n=1 Tax=Schwartzia succinivorans TaxID=55507 RepID=UPI002355214D|nr:response regulator [Schwartzia succinivorans]MBE6098007.1 response regulator [Schwartzia succinivorans]